MKNPSRSPSHFEKDGENDDDVKGDDDGGGESIFEVENAK